LVDLFELYDDARTCKLKKKKISSDAGVHSSLWLDSDQMYLHGHFNKLGFPGTVFFVALKLVGSQKKGDKKFHVHISVK
jgi:hypothetical protein